LLFIYLYSHYAFATITARVSALYAAILIVILAAGTPPYLAVFAMSYVSSLAAALTHYGTTTSPIYYGARYTTPAASSPDPVFRRLVAGGATARHGECGRVARRGRRLVEAARLVVRRWKA